MYLQSYDQATISDSRLVTNYGKQGADIYSSAGKLDIQRVNITTSAASSSIYLESTSFTGNELRITNSVPQKTDFPAFLGGGVYAINPKSLTITSSVFKGLNFASRGGAIALLQIVTFKSKCSAF